MKIYSFKYYGTTDYVAGPNKEAIMQWYMNHTGFGLSDIMEMDITVVPRDEWKSNLLIDQEVFDAEDDEDVIGTFETKVFSMEPHTVEMIATTAY